MDNKTDELGSGEGKAGRGGGGFRKGRTETRACVPVQDKPSSSWLGGSAVSVA